jgi:putative nucleotidyltransferase with HDIG domain
VTRDDCLELVKGNCSNRNLLKHMLATEAVMRGLAERLGGDAEIWGTAGLVHDLDYDQTAKTPERHGLVSADMLTERGFREDVVHAVKAHNDKAPRESLMDKALYATDPVTGLIVAAVLMHPTKKVADVDVEFVMRRYKEKRFAAGANREQIQSCTDLGLSLEEFIGIAIESMRKVAGDLGL